MNCFTRLAVGFFASLTLIGFKQANAKILHFYDINLQAKTRDQGYVSGRYVDMISGFAGANCSSQASFILTEDVPNFKGQYNQKTYSQASDYSFNTQFRGQPAIASKFTVNFGHRNPQLNIKVQESCVIDTTVLDKAQEAMTDAFKRFTGQNQNKSEKSQKSASRQKKSQQSDSDQEETQQSTSDKSENRFITLTMHWDCSIKGTQLPTTVGILADLNCIPKETSWNSATIDGGLKDNLIAQATRHFKEKDVVARVALSSVDDHNSNYNCSEGSQNRKLIRISQGLQGGAGEDDFRLAIQLNNSNIVTEESVDGIFDSDLYYCPQPGQSSVNIKISGQELDFPSRYNDLYVPQNELNLNLDGSYNRRGVITLKRKNRFFSRFEDSQVVVEVLDPSRVNFPAER